jgi:hypothetical protein
MGVGEGAVTGKELEEAIPRPRRPKGRRGFGILLQRSSWAFDSATLEADRFAVAPRVAEPLAQLKSISG